MIRQRQPAHQRQEHDEIALDPSRTSPHQLGAVRVPLVWQHRAPAREGVVEPGEADVRRGPQDDLASQAREVADQDRERRNGLERVVAVGDRVDGVVGHAAEAEGGSNAIAVDRQAGAGDRPGAGGRPVGSTRRVGQAARVTVEHLDVREQVVRQQDRLSGLGMGVRREDRMDLVVGPIEQDRLEVVDCTDKARRLRRKPAALIRHDLLVPAPPRLQHAPELRADRLDDGRLHVHVDVLVLRAPRKRAVDQLPRDLHQGVIESIRLGLPEQLEAAKLRHVGAAGRDVMLGEGQVDLERSGQRERRIGGGGLEATVPQGGLARGVHLSIHTR